MQARDSGSAAYKLFREERLESDPPLKKFFDPLEKQNLKTFSDLKVKKAYQAGGRQIIPEGTLRKTTKSTLAKRLRKDIPPAESIPNNSAFIIDGMALVQKLNAYHMCFSEVSRTILGMALSEGASCARIDIVFDVYRSESIKNAERANRGSSSGIPFKTISPGHTIKQWRNFLSCSENKNCLIQFLVNDWCTDGHRQRQQIKGQGKELYVTVGEINSGVG
jgi:hypothetical protein